VIGCLVVVVVVVTMMMLMRGHGDVSQIDNQVNMEEERERERGSLQDEIRCSYVDFQGIYISNYMIIIY
jgi:cytochrome c-type biogenesis protein CcmH/NrfF